MLKIIFKIFIIFFVFTNLVHSQNFNKIIIDGNERISKETILVFLELPDDKFLDEETSNTILKKLYESGYFESVSIRIQDGILEVNVIENPIIQTVFVEGIKNKKLLETLNDKLFLKDRSSFNSTQVKKDENTILNFLNNEGYLLSTVKTSIEDLSENKIDLFYKVDLGEKAKISKISFIGDKKFKDGTLKNIILSEEYKPWKFISGKKYLNENLINYDKK